MRTGRLGLLLCVLAWACGLHLAASLGTDSTSLRPIEERLEQLRGLTFLHPVPLVRIPAGEAKARRVASLDSQRISAELALLSRVYSRLGVVPPGTDLKQVALGLYRRDFTDYYDPGRGEIVTVEREKPDGLRTRALEALLGGKVRHEELLVYELARALHHQQFPAVPGGPPLAVDDSTLALQAVLEGDAVLSTFAYAGGKLDAEGLGRLANQARAKSLDTASLDTPVPPGIRPIVTFPYLVGTAFVVRALAAHGWSGVDALIAHPPRSTEQVLHPQRYYEEIDDPQSVQIPALHDRREQEWPILGEWTLGELRIGAVLAQATAAETAREAAAGWDGDRLRALEVDGKVGLVWLSVWDDTGAAAEFFGAYRDLLAARYPESPPVGGAARLESPPEAPVAYLLEHRDQRVLAIEALPREEQASLAEQVWERAILVPQRPTLPWLDLASAPRVRDADVAAWPQRPNPGRKASRQQRAPPGSPALRSCAFPAPVVPALRNSPAWS